MTFIRLWRRRRRPGHGLRGAGGRRTRGLGVPGWKRRQQGNRRLAGQGAVAGADLVRHPRDPAAMLRRAGEFAFPMFKQNLLAALNG